MLIALRVVLGIKEWDQFLCVNSAGIFVGFRTAFAQGFDENIRCKLNKWVAHIETNVSVARSLRPHIAVSSFHFLACEKEE